MRGKGFRDQIGVIPEWARRRRLAEKADQSVLPRTPSARSIARLIRANFARRFTPRMIVVKAVQEDQPDVTEASIE
ncbi:hypothetical protein MES5069_310065 [Mesorhizobium escarrei]|uniref:Uncharacterized protein n=1 Tax=Mesorhizobium escarrei TaxID=666018 RepID=A0ABN8K1P6_9HYPH|nr:hypothetical protein MES5069_310065 [Mesorhizobium escarrei]